MLRVNDPFIVCAALYVINELLHMLLNCKCSAGKRRYDRKQSGYGGQTKPIFRKKVCFMIFHICYKGITTCEIRLILIAAISG